MPLTVARELHFGRRSGMDRQKLEDAILADPDNIESWQVYADWLQEKGDVRGDIIARELAGDASAVATLIEENAGQLLGPLADHQKTHDGEDTDAFTWKRGFIFAARLSHNSYDDDGFEGSLAAVLRDLLAHPSGRFLSEITFNFNNDPNEDNLQDLIDILAEKAPTSLRKLHFGDYEYAGPSDDTATGETEISWYAIGDLSKLWPSVANLRTLITQCGSSESTISGDGLTIGELDLPELVRAEFRTGGLEADNVRAIVSAKIPKIEHLDIWFGIDEYGGDASIDDVAPLLARTDLPKLSRLGLRNATFTDELIPLIIQSKLLPQLEVLDLSLGCLTDAGAAAIVASADAFKHLRKLDVNENMLTGDGLTTLKTALDNIASEEQREDEDDDPEYRYAAVAE